MCNNVRWSCILLLWVGWLGFSAPALQAQAPPAPAAPPGAPLAAAPYLRTVLPKDALVYLRLASPWGLLGVPKGNMLSEALASASVHQVLHTLHNAIIKTLLGPLQPQLGPLPGVLLGQIRSPVEVVILQPTDKSTMQPDVLMAVQLHSATRDEVNGWLYTLTQAVPAFNVLVALNESGVGRLQIQEAPVLVSFDPSSRRLFLLLTQQPTDATLTQRLQSLQPRADAPMLALEGEIDASGQEFFLWCDARSLNELAQNLLPAAPLQRWQAFGGAALSQVAAGMGTSQGKGRLKLVLDMPRVGVRTLLPGIRAPLGFQAAGTPTMVVIFGLPNAEDWQQAEGFLKTVVPEVETYLVPLKERVLASTGLRVDDWLNLFGPELAAVTDAAGQYNVLRLRDPARFATVLELLQKQYGFRYTTRELNGQTYAHLAFPDMSELLPRLFPELGAVLGNTPLERLVWRWLALAPGHLYWKSEGEYLIFAQVPQVLLDRDRITAKTSVQTWLRDVQKLPGDDALFLVSTQVESIPRQMYTVYLQMLQGLGDVVGQALDMFTLPSAMTLQLPQHGSYGIKLASSANRLALEATYESTPMEFVLLGGSGLYAAAFLGSTLAVALPQMMASRQDAEITRQMAQITPFKAALGDFYLTQGRFPTEDEFADVFADLEDTSIAPQIEVEPDTGVIVLYVKHEKLGDNNRVYFTPSTEDGTVQWSCRADFDSPVIRQACQ